MHRTNLILLVLPVFMTACLDIETVSVVHQDGSIDRQIELKGSENDIAATSFNIPRRDTSQWLINREVQSDKKLTYLASRSFASVSEMNQSYEVNSNPLTVKIVAAFEKSHGFFYTRFSYQERIWADLPGPALDLGDYLNEAEVKILLDGEKDDTSVDSVEMERLDQQLDKYLKRRIFEDFLSVLRTSARIVGRSAEVEAVLVESGDTLQSRLDLTDFYDENLVWKTLLGEFLDTAVVEDIERGNSQGLVEFYERWQFVEDVFLNDHHFNIQMPGVIRQTNANQVLGNMLSWNPESGHFFFGEGVILKAESAQVNIWSAVLAGMVLVLTLLVTIVGYLRNRPRF